MIFPVRPGPRRVALLPCSVCISAIPSFLTPRRAVLDSRRRTAPALSTLPACQDSSHIDKCVGHYPESDPSFHAFLSPIPAAVEAVPPFEHADPALAARPPFLPLAEPAFLLVLPARRAPGRTSSVRASGPSSAAPLRPAWKAWFLMTAVALLATMIAAAEAARTDLISVLHSEQGFANCRSHRLLTSTRPRREHDARAGCTHRLAHAFIRPHSSLPLAAAGFNAKADRLKKFGRGCRAYVLKPWHKV